MICIGSAKNSSINRELTMRAHCLIPNSMGEQRHGWFHTCFIILALVMPSAIRADEPSDVRAVPERNAMLEKLADSIKTAVRKTDTAYPVFHGCIDWHSAVHGHWALLRIAATTGTDDALADWVVAALTPDGIVAEAGYLRDHPQFEMPYGRAWFLRLAIEDETWARRHQLESPAALKTMADEVAQSLEDRFKTQPPTPNSREYGNDSWARVQLYAFYQHRGDDDGLKHVSAIVREHFLNSNASIRFGDDFKRPEFFSRFGNWAYLIAHTQDGATLAEFLKAHPIDDDELRPVEPVAGVAHHLGVNWSRAWALRALARKTQDPQQRERFDQAYLAHVNAGMAEHEKAKDDYRNYGHWVPQFAVYALTE
jgi:hypothetical protein